MIEVCPGSRGNAEGTNISDFELKAWPPSLFPRAVREGTCPKELSKEGRGQMRRRWPVEGTMLQKRRRGREQNIVHLQNSKSVCRIGT